MSNASLETFLVSGLLVLITAIVYLAWSAWRWVDRERDMQKLALTGVTYEMRSNLERLLAELSGLSAGTVQRDIDIVPVIHPQLDSLLSRPNEADRRGLTVLRSHYNDLSAHKTAVQRALSENRPVEPAASLAAEAVIGSLATLYLWEEHGGCPPQEARSTRSWDVRDWMKARAYHADMLPGLHLRDQVVERLRDQGMTLTPKPLSHTASEFYSMQYDRKADRNAPFWKRKAKPAVDAPLPPAEAAAEAPVPEAAPVEDAPAPPIAAETPVAADPAPKSASDADAAAPEPSSEIAPPKTGLTH